MSESVLDAVLLASAIERMTAAHNASLHAEENTAPSKPRTYIDVPSSLLLTNSGASLCPAANAASSGTARLEEAVTGFRAALEERTRERVPLDWALTQNNLGNALWKLGDRESRTARLEEVVTAYRAALQERTPRADEVASPAHRRDGPAERFELKPAEPVADASTPMRADYPIGSTEPSAVSR
jgi:hypothetical protein